MLTHLLDTSIYSQRLKVSPHEGVIAAWNGLGNDALAVSTICEAELLYGLEKKNSARLWQEYNSFLKGRLTILPVDWNVAQKYGRLRAELEKQGDPVADMDLLIACTALSHDLKMVTANTQHFSKIPGLEVEDWSLF